jgi:hypothetical protein
MLRSLSSAFEESRFYSYIDKFSSKAYMAKAYHFSFLAVAWAFYRYILDAS